MQLCAGAAMPFRPRHAPQDIRSLAAPRATPAADRDRPYHPLSLSCLQPHLFPPSFLILFPPHTPPTCSCLVIIVTLVLGMVALHRNRALLKWAKGCMAVANALVATAAVLVPAGYVLLDDICPAGAHEASCGALCASTGMDYFELCSPYDADLAQWLAVGGAGALFLACFVSVLLPTESKCGILSLARSTLTPLPSRLSSDKAQSDVV